MAVAVNILVLSIIFKLKIKNFKTQNDELCLVGSVYYITSHSLLQLFIKSMWIIRRRFC